MLAGQAVDEVEAMSDAATVADVCDQLKYAPRPMLAPVTRTSHSRSLMPTCATSFSAFTHSLLTLCYLYEAAVHSVELLLASRR